MLTTSPWPPYQEPPATTLIRTVGIAVAVGAILSFASHAGLARWPRAALLMLWPTLGGHFIELFFLNALRPRLPATRAVQAPARIITWFIGGCLLAIAMYPTAKLLGLPQMARGLHWWIGGLAFIGIELIAHLALYLRGKPSFYNARG